MLPCFFIIFGLANLVYAEKIAVFEYNPVLSTKATINESVLENINEFRRTIMGLPTNNKPDLIVFPAFGLTGETLNVSKFKVFIPAEKVEKRNYKGIIEEISAMAFENQINILVNLIEDSSDGNTYNTAVLFDNNGTIQTKYRKRSLNTEDRAAGLKSGSESKTVTIQQLKFSLAINEDLLNVDQGGNSDGVIVLSSWNHMLPYRSALSIFAGYALANQKHVIVAGLNSPENGKSGSGIFVYQDNSTLAMDVFLTGNKGSKVIIGELTKTTLKKPPQMVRALPNQDELKNLRLQKQTNVKDKVEDAKDNMKISTNQLECSMYTTLTTDLPDYKLVVDNLKDPIEIGHKLYDVTFCGLLVYVDESYGSRVKTEQFIKNITIEVAQNKGHTGTIYPVSLDYNLKPLATTKFAKKGNSIATIEAAEVTDVISFGHLILTEKTKSSAASFLPLNFSLIIILVCFILYQ